MNKAFKIFKIIVFAILLLSVFTVGFVFSLLDKINRPDPITRQAENTPLPGDEKSAAKITEEKKQELRLTTPKEKIYESTASESDTIFSNKDIINIMLIGQDSRNRKEKGRSDAMILATINTKDRTISLTSFMRDLYVQIPGYKDNRLNLSYQLGGMRLLKETIEKNFHIPVDGNIEVDFKAFEEAVNRIGGIDIEINEREARYLGYEKAGVVHMDGRMALIYARLRAVGNSDYERTDRQRKILTAAYDKVVKMNPVKVIDLLNNILPMVTTDMTNTEILRLAGKALSVDFSKPETYRIPVEGGYKPEIIRGMSVLKPDLDKNRKALQEIIYRRK
jgi:LCP family protein required for cell wall assembly